MKASANRWWKGLALTVLLSLVAVTARSLITWPDSAQTVTPVAPSPSTPGLSLETPTLAASPTTSPTPFPTATSNPTRAPTSTSTVTPMPPSPTATPTPTPTPDAVTGGEAMPTPHAFPPGIPTPTPVVITQTDTISRTLTAPDPLPLVGQPDNVINILLLGSDQRDIGRIGRTDTIVIATIDPEIPSVSLLSIPRDFYAWMPGHGFGKINTAFSQGGPQLLEATIRYNFGVEIDYYARIGFDSFVKIVDTLGGVTVAVECPLHDTFLKQEVHLEPGIRHLDGTQALQYVRSRHSTSDFDRNRRQQQVLRGLYHQALNLGVIPKIPSLWGAVKESIVTDLNLQGVIRLGAIGTRLNTLNVKSRFVGGGVVEPWTGPGGAYVLIPDLETLESLVTEALAPSQAGGQQGQRHAFRVEIVDGTPNEGWEQVAAERLRWEGFRVVATQPADGVLLRTQIVDLRATPGGWPLSKLMRLYGRESGDVISRPEGTDVDFQVLLGADYDPCTAVRGR